MVICHALTFSLQVGQIKAEMSEATSAYLDKIPDKNQYMASAGKMHGWKTQGHSESAHHANAASRNLHPVEALMTQVRADQKRFFRRRTEAHNQHKSTNGIPDYQAKKITETVQKSFKHQGLQLLDDADKKRVLFPSLTEVGVYEVDLRKRELVVEDGGEEEEIGMQCECLAQEVENHPCSHMIAAARFVGIPLYKLFYSEDTTIG